MPTDPLFSPKWCDRKTKRMRFPCLLALAKTAERIIRNGVNSRNMDIYGDEFLELKINYTESFLTWIEADLDTWNYVEFDLLANTQRATNRWLDGMLHKQEQEDFMTKLHEKWLRKVE